LGCVEVVEAPKGGVADSDLLAGLDGLLREEDLDLVGFIINVG
jgi:hypothetical protein